MIEMRLSNLNEDERGSPRGSMAWHGRGMIRAREETLLRSIVGDLAIRFEWSLRSRHCGVQFNVGGVDFEEVIGGHAGLPPAAIFWHVEHTRASRLLNAAAKRLGLMHRLDYGDYEREVSLSVHDWAVWWRLWHSPNWSSLDGKPYKKMTAREGCWHPFGRVGSQVGRDEEIIETAAVQVPMPEGLYEASAIRYRVRIRGASRWIPFGSRDLMKVSIDLKKGIPEPGKGENSWDCGDDAAFGITCAARSIEEAVGILVGSVLETRRRRGGRDWHPKREDAPAGSAV